MERELTDQDKICFGKYIGTKFIDLEAKYLLWLYDQEWFKAKSDTSYEGRVRKYIKDNLQVLRKEAQK